MDISGKSVMILGDGISGKGAYKALSDISRPYFYHEELFKTDSSGAIALKTDQKPDIIIVSPGIATHPALEYAKQNGIPAVSELELGYMLNKTPIVAITGTNGKTTVTRLIGDILSKKYRASICGNIGTPFCLAAGQNHEIAAVEVSSFQLEGCFSFRPDIAVITNITPDHLDRHGNMQSYIKTKLSITKNQDENDFLIAPFCLNQYLDGVRAKIVYSDIDCTVFKDRIYFYEELIMRASDIPLLGAHNLKNVMQAICVAKLLSIENKDIKSAVKEFKPDPHRIEFVCRACNKNWYDDSKATNIDSCLSACNSMSGDTALILGGSDKGYDYDLLFSALPTHIKKIYIMGEVRQKLFNAALQSKTDATMVKDLAQAVTLACKTDVKNVLLSPAAASFDCFKDYKDRGECFKGLVKQLKG